MLISIVQDDSSVPTAAAGVGEFDTGISKNEQTRSMPFWFTYLV